MGDIKLIAGLGNPGDVYSDTRHNIGFKVIDVLADKLGIEVKQKKFSSLFGQGEVGGKKLILVKPWLYMNNSGQAVATAAGFFKLSKEDLLVVTDDMALEVGKLRLRMKGTAGGHNGLADIIEKLGTNEFCRLRVGIGQSVPGAAVGHVLGKPSKEEQKQLQAAIEQSALAVICWLENGINIAMNKFNSEGKNSKVND